MKQYNHNSGPGIIIGIPTLGRPVHIDWAFALKSMNMPTNYNSIYHLIIGKPIDEARNEMVKFAIEKDAKYLFFIGDDVICPNHTIRQLIYRLEQNPDIGVVGGVYCTKTEPAEPLVYRGNGKGCYWDWKIGEFFECTGMGMDCTIIRVDLLRKLGDLPFKTVSSDEFLDAKNKSEDWTEDLYFYNRVLTETSYKVYCDASVICGHWDYKEGKTYRLPSGSLPMRQKLVTKDKRCLIVGPHIQIAEVDQFDILRVGMDDGADYRTNGSLPFDSNQFDWVIVTDPGLSTDVAEYKRVVRDDGKITMQYHPLIDQKRMAEVLGGKEDGQFIEVKKNVDT